MPDPDPRFNRRATDPENTHSGESGSEFYIDVGIHARSPIEGVDSRESFWSLINRLNSDENDEDPKPAGDWERTFLQDFVWELGGRFDLDFPDYRTAGLTFFEPSTRGREFRIMPRRIRTTRFVFSIESYSYHSLDMRLGVPNFDSLLELVGNNLEVLRLLFGQYLPSAFSETLSLSSETVKKNFDFSVAFPAPAFAYARSRILPGKNDSLSKEASETSNLTPKQKGLAVIANVAQSAGIRDSILLIPLLIIVFLWYQSIQTSREDRENVRQMIQVLTQQQTETMRILRDAAIAPKKTDTQADSRDSTAQSAKKP